ncbi:Zn(II)2Cys6 transcription factor [Aspergillus melleus]|uniref:Zn(II)2Cys6 transcription factor n=1 Tax=Aspergillus melleus TaxID=138277 RepID=UPI001E8E157D|nr:uncharacterized protein LDX57_010623 [Aspergillus melleus]KAH8432988.1 hypothetical protein LDX57_010623 [Aspergillus melleus]
MQYATYKPELPAQADKRTPKPSRSATMDVPCAERNAPPASPPALPSKRLESIRASCDNCAKSKVRCSKEQPRCQRCIYQGANCIYSPSQRARKRPLEAFHARPRRRDTSNGPGNAAETRDTALFDGDSIEQITDFKDGNASTEPDRYVFSTSSMFHADVDSLLNWDDSVATLDEQSPSNEEAAGLLDALAMPPMPRPDLHRTLDDPESQFPWLFRHEKETPPLLSQGLMAGAPSDSPRAHHHHCTNLAISTIQKLDMPMASCPSLSSPGAAATTPVSMASHGAESLSFDTILQDNHAALDNLLTILHCSCAAKSDLVLLITMVCSQILCWYQASLDRSANNNKYNGGSGSSSSISGSNGTHSRGSSAVTSTLRDDMSRSPFERVSIPSIRIGMYTLDHEHSDRMVAQLILTELMRMKEVVEVFSRTYCYRGDYATKYTSRGAVSEESRSHLHQALEAFLRSRLKKAVRTACERLNPR